MGLLSTFGAASGRAFGLTRLSAAIKDAYFNLTTLLLPGNGTNGAQNNTFLDSSTNNFTITRNGNTTQGTFSPFSQTGWSNAFNGSSDYLSITATSALQLDNATAFTIEFWVYPNSIPASGSSAFVLRAYNLSSPFQGYGIAFGGNALNTNLQFWDGTAWADIGTVSANQWTHVAITYTGSGTTRRYFINGVQQGSAATVPSSINWTGTGFIVGARNADMYFNGYISNLRILKGTAQYTAAFTPPTSALTAITNTSLLTCQSNRFVDNSTNAFAITVTGTPSVQAFSPFAPTAAYSAATNGGSGYFDGTGDYLSGVSGGMPSGQGTAFTLRTWVYVTSLAAARVITRGDSPGRLEIRIDTNGSVSVDNVSTATICATAAGAVRINEWTHIAITRTTGNIYTIYVNGVSSATSSAYSTSITANDTIGYSAFSGSNYFVGYMSGFRVTTTLETISVPTAPPTAITGTSLLLNFTNAGITDATAKNVLETVGNAQISTTQSKFGGSSIRFDGTGDWLSGTPVTKDLFAFGTGDFTVEFWAWKSANGAANYDGVICLTNNRSSGSPSWWVELSSSRGFLFYLFDGSNKFCQNNTTTGINDSTWHHWAICRSGSTWYLFKDGTALTKTTDTIGAASIAGGTFLDVGRSIDLGGTTEFNGYINDLRVTKGYARYTANFTPPSTALPLR